MNPASPVLIRFARAAFVAATLFACGSGDGDSTDTGKTPPSSSSNTAHCTAIGATCNMASNPCCSDNGAETRCTNGICERCGGTNDSCDGDSCCAGSCVSGTCCAALRQTCSSTSDCCNGECQGTCCIPSGMGTNYSPDCCSGSAHAVYCGQGADQYICGSTCD